MSDIPEEGLTVIPEEATTTAEDYIDPLGEPPEGMPDPLPDALQPDAATDQAFADQESMEGDAPTS